MSSSYAAAKAMIPGLLKDGPLCQSRLVALTECDSSHVSSALKSLCRERKAKCIGKAGELGMTQFKAHAKLFALSEYVINQKGVDTPVSDPNAIAGGEFRFPTRRAFSPFVYPGGRSHRGGGL